MNLKLSTVAQPILKMQKLFTTAALVFLTTAVELNDITSADKKTLTLPENINAVENDTLAQYIKQFIPVIQDTVTKSN